MKLSALRQLFARPRLVKVARENAPIALGAGRSALRVVVEGAGVLTVCGTRRFFTDGFDESLLVPPGEIEVRVRSLVGSARARAEAPSLLSPAPAQLRVAGAATPAASNEAIVVVPRPSVGATAVVGPAVRRMSPPTPASPRTALPQLTLCSARLRPRVQLPSGGRP